MTRANTLLAFADELEKLAFLATTPPMKVMAKVQQHFEAQDKDWKSFEKNMRSPNFRAAILKAQEADPKLKRYIRTFGEYQGSKDELARIKSKDSGRTYVIKDLHNGRWGCNCGNWQFKKSIHGGDCKHIKSVKQSKMVKTAAVPRAIKMLRRAKIMARTGSHDAHGTAEGLKGILQSGKVKSGPGQYGEGTYWGKGGPANEFFGSTVQPGVAVPQTKTLAAGGKTVVPTHGTHHGDRNYTLAKDVSIGGKDDYYIRNHSEVMHPKKSKEWFDLQKERRVRPMDSRIYSGAFHGVFGQGPMTSKAALDAVKPPQQNLDGSSVRRQLRKIKRKMKLVKTGGVPYQVLGGAAAAGFAHKALKTGEEGKKYDEARKALRENKPTYRLTLKDHLHPII